MKKKMKKKFKKNLRKIVVETLLVFSFYAIIFSTALFFIGFHNLDIGQNIRYINSEYNLTLTDSGLSGDIVTGDIAYKIGVAQMFTGFFLAIWSSFIFGLCLSKLKYHGDRK